MIAMSNEGLKGPITIENEADHLKETNAIQMALFEHWHGFKEEDRFANEWIPRYSKRFREILEDEIRINPRLIEEWKDPSTRDAVIDRFGKALYGEHLAKEEEGFARDK